jgi:hypothetical protein
MKREILCGECKKKNEKIFKRVCEEHPEEHYKFVKGKLKTPCYCDSCNKELFPALDTVFASSIWADHGAQPYYEWENEFLVGGKQDEQK